MRKPPKTPITHGTEAGYQRGCRERCCSDARRAVVKARRAGHRALVPAGPAREHLEALLAAVPGAKVGTLQGATGLYADTLAVILRGERASIAPATERAILAATAAMVRRDTMMVPAKATHQRLRSMQAQGYPVAYIARMLGMKANQPQYFDHDVVTAKTAAKVRALAEQIQDKPGPSTISAAYARSLGWYPLIHYTDDGELIPESLRCQDKADAADMVSRRPGPANLNAVLPKRWAVLRSITVDGMSITAAEEQHGTRLPTRGRSRHDIWETLGIRLEKFTHSQLNSRRHNGLSLSVPSPDSQEAWRLLVQACRAIPIDWVVLERGSWSVVDIDPEWDATAAWELLLLQVRALNARAELLSA